MAFSLDQKLVVAVSSSAVFDMRAADEVYQNAGEDAYRAFQRENLEKPFAKGVAYPFIRRLLNLNKLYPDQQIEVVVLSRNDPETGQRFFRSCQHYGLDITRGSFLAGKSPHPYIRAFNASVFLSSNAEDVAAAVAEGLPAGLVLPTDAREEEEEDETELRIAFDFDGVLADDEAENVYQQTKDLALFHHSEKTRALEPHNPGPLKDLITKISFYQRSELEKSRRDLQYKPAIRIAIITARNAPANERFVTTLRAWSINADETFFLGGIDKKRILDTLKPHLFFDDQRNHLDPSAQTTPSVHVPFGKINRPKAKA